MFVMMRLIDVVHAAPHINAKAEGDRKRADPARTEQMLKVGHEPHAIVGECTVRHQNNAVRQSPPVGYVQNAVQPKTVMGCCYFPH